VIEDTLRSQSLPPAVYWQVVRNSGFDAMVVEAEKSTGWHLHQNVDLRQVCEAALAAYRDWSRINWRLYFTLAATVTDMALCFIALPFTPRIACSQSETWTVLSAAIVLGITCLLLYVWLIVAMVRRPTE
jgi:hypothetical protein